MATATTYTGFEIDVTWHETAGAYSSRFVADARGLRNLRDALDGHDCFGRMYDVYGFSPAGRTEIKGAELAALRGSA